MSRPDLLLSIEAHGKLRLDAPTGRPLDLLADGETLWLDVPGWAELRALAPRSFAARGKAIRALANTLSALGMRLTMQSAGTPVCCLGHNVETTWLARLLGLAPARIPLSAILAMFRR